MPPVGRGRTGVLVLVQRQLLLRSVQEKLSLSGIKESRAGGSRIEHVPTHSDSGVDAVLSDLQSGQFPVLRRRDMNDDELDLDGDGIAEVSDRPHRLASTCHSRCRSHLSGALRWLHRDRSLRFGAIDADSAF